MSSQEHTNMRLYVGGLPYQTTEQDLYDLFGQTGNVTSATVITDRASGRSKGFGFVEMANDQEARSAIDQLNGTTLENRTITVSDAHHRQSTGSDRDRRPNNNYRSNRY